MKFTAHIRKSDDNQYYAVLVGRNGEDVFVGETKSRKLNVINLVFRWFPGVKVIDKTKAWYTLQPS